MGSSIFAEPALVSYLPREVEEAIAAHPQVLDLGVAAIADSFRGETVKAEIAFKLGREAAPDEIKALCNVRLIPKKVPCHYEFRSDWPKAAVGKILPLS
jgi:long-chain acyl-CoA synthetase